MIKTITKADPEKVQAAFAKSDEIVSMLTALGTTPEHARFQTLDGALNHFFQGDGTIVLWNGGAGLGEHGFHYTLYRQVEGKPGMSKYDAERMGAPELEGFSSVIGGGLVLDLPESFLANPRANRNWCGWLFHE